MCFPLITNNTGRTHNFRHREFIIQEQDLCVFALDEAMNKYNSSQVEVSKKQPNIVVVFGNNIQSEVKSIIYCLERNLVIRKSCIRMRFND